MTDGQLDKARRLRERGGFSNIDYVKGYIDQLPFEDESFDCVISNGVINLVASDLLRDPAASLSSKLLYSIDDTIEVLVVLELQGASEA